jgi:choline dehydrogenase-like flavoprotein
VNEVLFNSAKHATSVRIQQRGTANGASTITVKAKKEIVLSAGWLHTPQILQRSGIGPSALLKAAGIPVLVDNPGVGSNLQDHAVALYLATYTTDTNPNPGSITTNATFAALAEQEWTQHRTGPLSLTVGNTAAMVPLPYIASNYKAIIAKALSQDPATYLPKTYTNTNILGWKAQRDVLLASYASRTTAVTELPFAGTGAIPMCLEKPLSRGTVLLQPTDKYAEPTVDYNTLINPVDVDVSVAMLRYTRKWTNSAAMRGLTPTELIPGSNVTSDADLASSLRAGMGSSTAHSCCTAAMMPRALGGVVSPDLLVYGVTGLSVVDISIIPLIPAAHTCSTVYALAEKVRIPASPLCSIASKC